MSDISIIFDHFVQDTYQNFHNFFYYTGLSSPEYWRLLTLHTGAYFILNMIAAFLVAMMRSKKICPEILNEFPYRIIFPRSIVSLGFLMMGYVLVLIAIPNWLIDYLK